MKRLLNIFLLFSLSLNLCKAQFKRQLDSLCIMCNNINSDSEKVIALGKLANLYYTYKLNRQGDSVLDKQLLLADLSDNNNLILLTLFGDAITNMSATASVESCNKAIAFLQKGIDYAKSQNLYDYIAIGYTRMANILRKRGQYDKAISNAQVAVSYLPNIKPDSIKSTVYIEVGNAYMAKGEAVSACTNYNNAFDIAIKIKSVPLQSNIYHCFADMYFKLKDMDLAKEQLKQSLTLDKENKYGEGMIRDYYDLARVTDIKFYIEKAIEMSDSLHFNKYLLDAKRLMVIYYMVIECNKANKAINYLETEPDVKESYINIDSSRYFEVKGNIFYYSNNFDSALYYFKLAEYVFVKNFDEKTSRDIFSQIALTYQKLGNIPNAIAYYTKALDLSKKINDASGIASSSSQLSELYEHQGDYKQAYIFSKQGIKYSDSLRQLSKDGDLVLLAIERTNKKHEEQQREETQHINNKRNIQYMAITISLVIIFLGMLVIGMFPVSKLTIKMLGYFSFISLFEFIIMLIDNSFIAKALHNEPLKLWIVKIVLIALLVPLQHYLEHNLIKFLESRKLLEARTKFSLKNLSVTKWWQKMKKPAPVADAGIEEDTAVL